MYESIGQITPVPNPSYALLPKPYALNPPAQSQYPPYLGVPNTVKGVEESIPYLGSNNTPKPSDN